uniref:Zinc finger protein 451 n=1 Tax=Sarcophilus harrisii TaxID=9305 RepID=A0A7N4P4D8_SARHA
MSSPTNRSSLTASMPVLQSPSKSPPKSPPRGKWQCRICEDMFDSQESVKHHCMCLTSHQFHRYSCDHCKKSFHKIETLYRHCQDQHENDIKIKYFCGLCDLTFDVEEAFLSHYKDVHSIDYVFVSEKPETSIKNEDDFPVLEKSNLLTCGCRESYICKTNRKEDHSRCLQILLDKDEGDVELPDLDYLRTMTHIVFVDFDNWSNFFGHLPGFLNQGTFVWGFQGGNTNWKPPVNCKIFNYLNRIGCFFLHPRCSKRKDAADFAICMHAGRLDEQLPKQIPFTILSGDQGFLELQNQFKKTQRPAHILNPHHLEGDMMCALLNSISDTTKDSDSSENDRTRTKKNTVQEEEIKSREDVELQEILKRSLEEV